MIWSVLLALATFVVGAYVGWRRGMHDAAAAMLDVERALANKWRNSSSAAQGAKFREYKDSYQHHNRTQDP